MRLIVIALRGDPPLFALAEPYKLITVSEMLAIYATGLVSHSAFTVFAKVLHLGHKGISVVGIYRSFCEIGIYRYRLTELAFSLIILVKAVFQLEAFSAKLNDFINVALSDSIHRDPPSQNVYAETVCYDIIIYENKVSHNHQKNLYTYNFLYPGVAKRGFAYVLISAFWYIRIA